MIKCGSEARQDGVSHPPAARQNAALGKDVGRADSVRQSGRYGLLDGIGGAFGLVLGMTGACALLLLISLVSAVSAVLT